MSKFKIPEKYYNPYVVVVFSVLSSIIIYLIICTIIPYYDFIGLILSILIPTLVSFPISFFMMRHHKKTFRQKIELEKLNKLNNKLFSIIAHDIKGPLSIVKGYVEILQDAQKNLFAKEDLKYLVNLSSRVDNLLLFLDDLLKWSKNQISDKPLLYIPINAKAEIESIIALYEDVLLVKNISVEKNLMDTEIYSDKEAYGFIIRNLFYNAIKFSPKGGKICVDLHIKDNHVYTVVKDNGIGISEENLKKIKESDEWYSTNGTNNELGTGFGIKTSIQYLNLLNGKFSIESALKKGTVVTVILPTKSILTSEKTNQSKI